MSLRTRIAGWLAGKSLTAATTAFLRGDDVVDRPATRLVNSYSQSGWVHAAVNLISGEFTGLPLEFYAGEEPVDDAKLAAWWEAPALGPDRKPLPRALVDRWLALWLLTEGEFFLLLPPEWASASFGRGTRDLPRFVIANPTRVRLLVQGGELQGYEYIDPAGRRAVFLPEEVAHVMEPNPLDDWRGLGRAQVARVAAEGAFLTGTYVRDLMRNNGDQSFLVIGKNGVADDAQREQIAAALRARRAARRAGTERDLFLTGDLTIERPAEQAMGADLAATLTQSQQEIFVAFGVPPSMATVKQAYSLGKDSDRYQLITGTSQPLARQIAGAYAQLASRQTGLALTACHDWDDHPLLQEVRRARLEAGLKLWTAGMAWKDINAYLDLGMAEFPGWDIAYLPFSVAPVSAGDAAPSPRLDPATDPSLAEASAKAEDPQVQSLRLLLLARARAARPVCQIVNPKSEIVNQPDDFAAFACDHGTGAVVRGPRDPKQLAHWRTHMAKRRATVAAFKGALGRVLMQARVETLRKIEAQHIDPAKLSALGSQLSTPVQRNTAIDFVFDLAKFAASLRSVVENQHRAAIKTAGDQLFAEVGKLDPFAAPPVAVLEFLAQRENKLKDVPQAVFDRIKATLDAGLKAGETTAQLSARVKVEFNTLGDGEAKRIALTETGAAYGFGRAESMKQAGIQFKAWLTSGNANVRAAHEQAGLDYPAERGIPVDEPFVVDGEDLMYPGDAAGSARNVINCHCVSIAVPAPGADELAAE